MSVLERRFTVGEQPALAVQTAGGDVSVLAGDEGTIEVRVSGSDRALENVEIDETGGVVSVRTDRGDRSWSRRGVDVTVSVPPGCDVTLTTTSGDVRVSADVGDAVVEVASGDVRVGRVSGRLEAKAASGRVVVDEVGGRFSLSSLSGDVHLGTSSGDGSAATASGDVAIGRAGGATTVETLSGDVGVGAFTGPSLEIESVSGDIGIGFGAGLEIDADIRTRSGSVVNLVEPGSGGTRVRASLKVRSVSGDVVLRSSGGPGR